MTYQVICSSNSIVINSSGGSWSSGSGVRGSGKVLRESRQVGPFWAVDSRGSADVEIVVGREDLPSQQVGAGGSPYRQPAAVEPPLSGCNVQVEADDNIVPLITTEVRAGTLQIGVRGSFSTNRPIKVFVTTPTLTRIEVTGSGDITAVGVNAPAFGIAVTGSGEVTVAGSAGYLHAVVTGSGDIRAEQLSAVGVSASIAGSGDIRVRTEISQSVSGSGSIRRQK